MNLKQQRRNALDFEVPDESACELCQPNIPLFLKYSRDVSLLLKQ